LTASGCLLPCRQPSGKLVTRARSRRTVGKRRAVLYDAPLCAPAWKRWEGTGPCRPAVWLFRKDTPGPRAHTPSRATQTAARDAAGCCGDSVCMFKAMKCMRRTGQSEEVCSRSSRRTLRNRPSTTAARPGARLLAPMVLPHGVLGAPASRIPWARMHGMRPSQRAGWASASTTGAPARASLLMVHAAPRL